MEEFNRLFRKVEESVDFKELFEIATKYSFFKNIDSYSINYLDLRKIKNFILACCEEKMCKTKLFSMPYRLIIDPTNACNLGCPLCPTGLNASNREKGILRMNEFTKIVDQLKDYCIEIHLYNWGEPTLNKYLIEMLKYSKKLNIWSRISTNLSLNLKENYLEELVSSGLSLLHVDLDGLDQEVYEKYRRKGNVNIVIDNIKKIVLIKKKLGLTEPIIELSMLAMRQNEHQIQDFLKMKDVLGVDVVKVDKIQHNPNMDEKWLPKNKDLIYRSYGGNAHSNSAIENEITQCFWPWSGIVINWDGGVNPCCIIDDKNSDFSNANKYSIKEIWNSPEYISSRSEFGNRNEITKPTICNICKNQTHSKRLSRVSKSFAIKL